VSLDQLLAALERDAREQADRILAEARAEVERIEAAVEQDVAQQREVAVGAREREQRADLEQALSEGRRVARRVVLEARDRLLARVFTATRAALPAAIDSSAYGAALQQRVQAALTCFDTEEGAVVLCTPTLVESMRAAVAAHPSVRVCDDREVGSGFRVAAADGSLEVDDTLESRLAARQVMLARDALRRLDLEAHADVG
jgi:vacuolar-type H+-ATPase subunit E/Vma4